MCVIRASVICEILGDCFWVKFCVVLFCAVFRAISIYDFWFRFNLICFGADLVWLLVCVVLFVLFVRCGLNRDPFILFWGAPSFSSYLCHINGFVFISFCITIVIDIGNLFFKNNTVCFYYSSTAFYLFFFFWFFKFYSFSIFYFV